MDHADVREWLESAALERGGLELVRAGGRRGGQRTDPDPVVTAAILAHLESCAACRVERDAWLRTVDAVGGSTRTAPDLGLEGPGPELRERTLALVRATGVPRGGATRTIEAAPAAIAAAPAPDRDDEAGATGVATAESVQAAPVPIAGRRPRSRVIAWALAAAAVIVLVAGSGIAGLTALSERDHANADAAELARLTAAVDTILRDPSRQVVALRHPDGTDAGASVSWSQASDRLVVIATSLSVPPAGSVYRCWVENGGARRAVGTMWLVDGVGYWAGPIEGWGGIEPGSRFGVSLAPSGGSGGQVVLEGSI